MYTQHLALRGHAWGHDLTTLVGALPVASRPPADLVDRAKALDKNYLPSRSPKAS